MLQYRDNLEVRIGDRVRHANAEAVIEIIIEGEEVAHWGIETSGFMILCTECGRILIEPGSADWEDVVLVNRNASP